MSARARLARCAARWLVPASLMLLTSSCLQDERLVGETCQDKEQCLSGLCLQEERYGAPTGWHGGYCTATCQEQTCSSEASCFDLGGQGYCLRSCFTQGDCRDEYVCTAGVCLPDCRLGWSCGDSFVCGELGFCLDPAR